MTTIIKLYHGTTAKNIAVFKQLSHFGTRNAALGAAFAACHEKSEGRLEETEGYLYEVDITFDSNELAKFDEDWGGASAFALLVHLAELYPEKFEKARAAANLATTRVKTDDGGWRRDKTGREKLALPVVLAYFTESNSKLISYPNVVEDASGGPSYCVVDPKIISIVKQDVIAPEELSTGRRYLSPDRLSNLGLNG
ncbi:hypothetical protein ABIB42_004495 [Massilia sp. UYP32]|uniref:hypothetical protein n=1 Tax=Massilia sp. UYP32 TaxID=1756386 RepID=UPI003D1E4096